MSPIGVATTVVGYLTLLLSTVGSLLLWWAVTLRRPVTVPDQSRPESPSITILKPLHGHEPHLVTNLTSFVDQAYVGPTQIVFGVQRPDDPAIAVVSTLKEQNPLSEIALVVDPRVHGNNAKVSNLINLVTEARGEIIVISDSDMVVDPNYLTRLVSALDERGVGAVTCLYRGRGDTGLWSNLVAMGIDLHFLPATLIGLGTGLAHPCMGSTIAIRAETLAAVGGFEALANALADDYALGVAVRALGLDVSVCRHLITHACSEESLAALVRHELRWSATIAAIDPGGFVGSVVLHPFPIAMLAVAIEGPSLLTWTAVGLALSARAVMAISLGIRSWWYPFLIPFRDSLSFLIFFATFFVRSVDWRGTTLTIKQGKIVQTSKTAA